MKPALSLIVPNHNHAERLPRLFDSILAQSLKDLEVVLVDDCSDASHSPLPVVEAYRNKGLPVVFLEHAQRIYTMQARLAGIRAARGNIIGFADADDTLWGTKALAAHVALLRERQADIVHFRVVFTDSLGNFTASAPPTDPFAPQLTGRAILDAYLKAHAAGASPVWNKLYTRDLCLKVAESVRHTRVLRFIEDVYLFSRCCFYAQTYVGSERIGYGQHYVNKDAIQSTEHTVLFYHCLEEQLAWLTEQGADEATLDKAAAFYQKFLWYCAGQMCLNIRQKEPLCIADATVEALLRLGDAKTLIKALLIGNGKNAGKIIAINRLINEGYTI